MPDVQSGIRKGTGNRRTVLNHTELADLLKTALKKEKMRQLENHERDMIAKALFKKILNHSADLATAHLQNLRQPKTQKMYKTTAIGHIDGTYTFYFNNTMYVFDAHPASTLCRMTPNNGLLLPDSEHPIDAEFILTPEMAELTATKLLERPR